MNRQNMLARLRYEFDKSMAAGPIALIGWLAVISLAVIIVAAAVIALTQVAPDGGQPLGFFEAMWESLVRTLDSGTMGSDTGWGFRGIMLIVTLAGIFLVSTLIGIISSGIEGRVDELRKGRSRVLETDHTVILNWSASIFDIISELTIANESRKRPRIVIMADKDKVEMEDEISDKVPNLRNTRVICRNGDPTDLYDLAIVSAQQSRSVIVLSPEGEDPDSAVIKTVLALVNDPARRIAPYRIAAEVIESKNAELAQTVGGAEVQLVLADELISRIVVNSSRQSGLSVVYSELLDFDGSEIYVAEEPALAGRSFGEAVLAYDSSTLIGVCHVDGRVQLNPPMDMPIGAGMKAILIAEDDSTIKLAERTGSIDASALAEPVQRPRQAERTLILGWNRRGPLIVLELSRFAPPGSTLMIAADTDGLADAVAGLDYVRKNLEVSFTATDTGHRPTLEALDIPAYNHVLVLGYSDTLGPQQTDTRTLVTLLHLRKITEAAGVHVGVVSEMIDVRNRELAEVTRADDFVVSNRLVSLMLAQASENEYLAAIFDDLLDEAGSEIYMRPAGDYVATGRPVNFYTVSEAARRRGEVALGYAKPGAVADDGRELGGVVVNPAKSPMLSFSPGDRIIVLAEN